MEEVTDADYMHRKRVCKDFVIKNFGEYHHLRHKRETLFWQMFLKNLEISV